MQQDLRSRPDIEIVPDAPTEPDAFLRWSAERPREEGRYELSRGVVTRTMSNVTRRHAVITSNLVFELSLRLDRSRYNIMASDFAVRTPLGTRGPDILVEAKSADLQSLASENPILLAEILSPSSEDIDFIEKLEEYTAIASLRAYVILSQEKVRAWVLTRNLDGTWPDALSSIAGRIAAIDLPHLGPSLGLKIGLDAVYQDIPVHD